MSNNCGQPPIYPNFIPDSIIGGVFTFKCFNNIFRNYKTTAGANFALDVLNVRNGGSYYLLVTKTIAPDVVITLPVGSVVIGDFGANTITLQGAANEHFLIRISHDGTNYVFEQVGGGGQVAPGVATGFSPNVVPFIDGTGNWAEDVGFKYQGGKLTIASDLEIYKNGAVYVHGNNNSTIVGHKFEINNNNGTWVEFGNVFKAYYQSGLSAIYELRYGGKIITNSYSSSINLVNNVIGLGRTIGQADIPFIRAKVHIIGASNVTGNALAVSGTGMSTIMRLVISNYGEHAINGLPQAGNLLSVFSADGLTNLFQFKQSGILEGKGLKTQNIAEAFNQLIVENTFTPSGAGDANGSVGAIAWDASYLYIKTAAGAWKRTALSSW